MNIFYCLSTAFGLLLSIATFVFVLSWQRQRGKFLMVAFVFTGFILPQVIDLLLNLHASLHTNRFLNSNYLRIYQIVASIAWLCRSIGSCFLLSYAVFLAIAKPNTRLSQPGNQQSDDRSHRYDQSDFQNDVDATQTSSLLPMGPSWNVPPSLKLNVKILRQREWGFLIDFMPFVLGIFLVISTLAMRLNSSGVAVSDDLNNLLWATFWLTIILQFVYALFKDCAGGRSLGKHFTGCRVVDLKTGKPAPASRSILRNLPFLIPFFSIVELATASIRPDSRRLGDLLAGTTVVTGPPDFIDGEPVEHPETTSPKPVKKHPLDD